MDMNKIRSLAAEYEQAEARVEKLEKRIEALHSGKSKVAGILIYNDPYYAPDEIEENAADGMDKDYIHNKYCPDVINSMECEIKDHKKYMNNLIEAIKKELQL